MKLIFKPDRFSTALPPWDRVQQENREMVESVASFLPGKKKRLTRIPQQLGGLEVNSKNFRLFTSDGKLILKKWPHGTDPQKIKIQLELMSWLKAKGVPVPAPIYFSSQRPYLHWKETLWSAFEFVDGDYFSGKGNQLVDCAKVIGKLNHLLKDCPRELCPFKGPVHFSTQDSETLKKMEKSMDQWDLFFGKNSSNLLKKKWNTITSLWRKISNNSFSAGKIQATHFDLHPHNILVKNNKLVAILDFDSCKRMPMGYGLAYAVLKLSRQAVAAHGNVRLASKHGRDFLQALIQEYPSVTKIEDQLPSLALAEVLRRMTIIFRLNLEQVTTQWNQVLPIQLAHLDESSYVFDQVI